PGSHRLRPADHLGPELPLRIAPDLRLRVQAGPLSDRRLRGWRPELPGLANADHRASLGGLVRDHPALEHSRRDVRRRHPDSLRQGPARAHGRNSAHAQECASPADHDGWHGPGEPPHGPRPRRAGLQLAGDRLAGADGRAELRRSDDPGQRSLRRDASGRRQPGRRRPLHLPRSPRATNLTVARPDRPFPITRERAPTRGFGPLGLSRDNSFLALGMLPWGATMGFYQYVLPLYLTELGASPDLVGLALAIGNVGSVVAILVGGLLVDRYSRRKQI